MKIFFCSSLQGFAKRFSVGVFIQLILHLTKSPIQYFKHPLSYFRSLNRSTLSLGLFFGFYSGIYRVNSTIIYSNKNFPFLLVSQLFIT